MRRGSILVLVLVFPLASGLITNVEVPEIEYGLGYEIIIDSKENQWTQSMWDDLEQYGIKEIERHDKELTKHALNLLTEFTDLELYGPSEIQNRSGVVSFNLQNVHSHDVAQIFDENGIALRAGHHCTQVLHERLGVPATVRLSLGIYNDYSEIDRMFSALDRAREIFLH